MKKIIILMIVLVICPIVFAQVTLTPDVVLTTDDNMFNLNVNSTETFSQIITTYSDITWDAVTMGFINTPYVVNLSSINMSNNTFYASLDNANSNLTIVTSGIIANYAIVNEIAYPEISSGKFNVNLSSTPVLLYFSSNIPNISIKKGQPFIENFTDFLINMNEDETVSKIFLVNNTGDYALSDCQPTLIEDYLNWNFYSWSNNSFNLDINETLNLYLTFTNPPPTTYDGHLQITCNATNGGETNSLLFTNRPRIKLISNSISVPQSGAGTTDFTTLQTTNTLFSVNVNLSEFNVTRGSTKDLEFQVSVTNDVPVTMEAKIIQNQSLLTFEDGSLEKFIPLYATNNLNMTNIKYKLIVADNITNGVYQTSIEYKVGSVTSMQKVMINVVDTPTEAVMTLLSKPVTENIRIYQIILIILSFGIISFFVVKTKREITRFIK